MKTFMTTAAILAVLTAPVFAQAGSESRGEPQASGAKQSAQDPNEKDAKGQGAMQKQVPPSATTGAASDPAKDSAGSGTNVGPKTGVSSGGGSGGSAGGGGGSGNQ